MSTEKISCIVKSREVVSDGLIKVTIGIIGSNKTGAVSGISEKTRLGCNELPYILNTIRHSRYLDPESHFGFDYTFDPVTGDFPLERGWGFPYVLNFELEDERPSLT